jgi:hypothetical protein
MLVKMTSWNKSSVPPSLHLVTPLEQKTVAARFHGNPGPCGFVSLVTNTCGAACCGVTINCCYDQSGRAVTTEVQLRHGAVHWHTGRSCSHSSLQQSFTPTTVSLCNKPEQPGRSSVGASRHTRHLFAFRVGKFGFRRTLNVCRWNFILSRAGWYHCCQHANVSRAVCRYLLFAQVHVLEVPGSNPYIPSFTVVLSWYRWPVCEISRYTFIPYAELGYEKAKSKNT